MARKPPNKYRYNVGEHVEINCYPDKECGSDFLPDAYATAKRFAAVKGFGNTGTHLVVNRARNKTGVILDRTDGLYLVSYETGVGRNREVMCLCAEIEIKSVNPFDDAVVRWLGESREQL